MTNSLDDWEDTISDTMLWKGAAINQLDYFKKLGELSGCEKLEIISKHTSKSVDLPVVKISRPGLSMILRDNFYDIKLSVKSKWQLDHDLWGMGSGVTARDRNPVYFEGFDKSWVYPGFYQGTSKFSLSMSHSTREILPELIGWLFRKADHELGAGPAPGPEPTHDIIEEEKRMRQAHGTCPVISWMGYARPYPYKNGGFIPRVKYDDIWARLSCYTRDHNYYNPDTTESKNYPYAGVWPHLRLSFVSGLLPETEEEWLKVLNQIVGDNRKNTTLFTILGRPTGQSIQVTEMPPRLRELCRKMGLSELLRNDRE